MKIKENIKNNKRFLLGILVGLLISSGSVYAASIISKDVSYDNSSSKLTSTNVQGAIDELYKTATDKIAEAEAKCPEGYNCIKPICKRATTLHTEVCSQTKTSTYCQADGYALNDTITYGNLGTKGTLSSGDAFDCDVNGDGVYDPDTERFYYVSDMTNGVTSDSNTAVLVYYSNVSGGIESNESYAYDESGENFHGPVTAVKQLPTTSQWSNVSLTNTKRQITTSAGTTSTSGGTLPVFDYTGYAARLLTIQEVVEGCMSSSIELGTKCKYLMENTTYSSNNNAVGGEWLETAAESTSYNAYFILSGTRTIRFFMNNNGYQPRVDQKDFGKLGVRPAIEVLKSNISY